MPNKDTAPKTKAGAQNKEDPLRVSVVPDANTATDPETQEAENVKNRNKSYLPPQEGVNWNAPEKKEKK